RQRLVQQQLLLPQSGAALSPLRALVRGWLLPPTRLLRFTLSIELLRAILSFRRLLRPAVLRRFVSSARLCVRLRRACRLWRVRQLRLQRLLAQSQSLRRARRLGLGRSRRLLLSTAIASR